MHNFKNYYAADINIFFFLKLSFLLMKQIWISAKQSTDNESFYFVFSTAQDTKLKFYCVINVTLNFLEFL